MLSQYLESSKTSEPSRDKRSHHIVLVSYDSGAELPAAVGESAPVAVEFLIRALPLGRRQARA